MKKTCIAVMMLAALCMAGCYYDNNEDLYPPDANSGGCDTTGAVTYTAQVKTVLDSKCAVAGCHVPASAPQSGNADLSTYGTAFPLKDRIEQRALVMKNMPPVGSPQLTACEMAILQKWINTGAAQ